MMKLKQLTRIFCAIPCGILLALLISGCQTPAPQRVYVEMEPQRVYVERTVPIQVEVADTRVPLTIATIQRLAETGMTDISQFQLLLFGRVILEREYTTPITSREPDGRLLFENVHVRKEVIINDQTEGQAVRGEERNGELLLAVSFDDGDDFLVFSSKVDEPDSFFSLRYDTGGGTIPLTGDERGTLEFAGAQYRLRYTGNRAPYLMIRLALSDVDRLTTRILEGRRVR